MSDLNIKFLSIGRFTNDEQIIQYSNDSVMEKKFKKEGEKVFNQLKSINLAPDERQKVNTGNGSWYCTSDEKNIGFMVLTDSNYPERHAYGAIDSCVQHLISLDENYDKSDDSALKSHLKPKVKEICKKYDDLKSLDKLANAQTSVNQVQLTMENNLKTMIDSQESLTRMGDNADQMKSQSLLFNKQSTDIQKIMYYRNLKLKIFIGLIGVGVLLYIILSIFGN